MTSEQLSEHFRCQRLACVLTRGDCAARHRGYRRSKPTPHKDMDLAVTQSCGDCPIGAIHAGGEAHEAPTVALHRVFATKRFVPPRCGVCGEPIPRRQRQTATCSAACGSDWQAHSSQLMRDPLAGIWVTGEGGK